MEGNARLLKGGEIMSDHHYKTFHICIKKGHRLFPYCKQMCQNAKHLYNITNFYIRQAYTALRQQKPLQPLQKEALNTIHYRKR
jgi:putative transposase